MWHETRRSERKVHDIMDAACKPAQRLAVFLAKRRGDPQQSIQVVGSRCRLYRDDDLYQATEQGQGLHLVGLNQAFYIAGQISVNDAGKISVLKKSSQCGQRCKHMEKFFN